MKRAKEKKGNVTVFSNNHITINFNGSSKLGVIIVCVVVVVLLAKLLTMPLSDTNALITWISSLLSELGC